MRIDGTEIADLGYFRAATTDGPGARPERSNANIQVRIDSTPRDERSRRAVGSNRQFREALDVEFVTDARESGQRQAGRREGHGIRPFMHREESAAAVIARKQQSRAGRVDDRDGEAAVETLEHVTAPPVVGHADQLGVRRTCSGAKTDSEVLSAVQRRIRVHDRPRHRARRADFVGVDRTERRVPPAEVAAPHRSRAVRTQRVGHTSEHLVGLPIPEPHGPAQRRHASDATCSAGSESLGRRASGQLLGFACERRA